MLISVVIGSFQIEGELQDICQDVLAVLDKKLLTNATSGESRVFYYKM